MKRIFAVLAVAVFMAAMLAVMTTPALAQAQHGTIEATSPEGNTTGKLVVTPSGRVNANTHFKPAERQGGGGGGAEHFSGQTVPIHPSVNFGVTGASGKAVETPSGNINASFHG